VVAGGVPELRRRSLLGITFASPCKCESESILSTFGDRRIHGGRMQVAKHCRSPSKQIETPNVIPNDCSWREERCTRYVLR
jgi:hypothetical protein